MPQIAIPTYCALATSVVTGCILLSSSAIAQVIPDGTTPSTVTTNSLDHTITNGTAAGANLFHSFQRFDIPTGGSATFNLVNTPAITTIFSRVTGGNGSNIDGAIRTLNSTNPVSLFLMNPSGILFGPNASLNIGGSFLGTTASSIKFANGAEFASTATPLPAPLLTISVPIGLQMGANPGAITVQGNRHQLSQPTGFAALQFNGTPVGLQVSPGNTLALVGGNITLQSGILTAAGGRLDLGAVQPTSIPVLVGLRPEGNRWALDYGTIQQFGDINLQQQSLVNASGSGNGAIQIQARNLLLQDGSAVVWEDRGSQAGSGITIRTTDTVQLLRPSPTGFDSGIYSDAKSTGSTGDLSITTANLVMQAGSTITSRTFSTAPGGNITVNAATVKLWSPNSAGNQIATRTLSSGRGGNLTFNAQRLSVYGGGGLLATVNRASGNGGNLTVNVSESIDLISGPNGIVARALLSASAVGGTGNAGDITVNTGRLTLSNGAGISSSTFGTGNGGKITVNASESIDIIGTRTDPINGFVRTSIQSAGVLLPAASRTFFGLSDTVMGAAGSVVLNTPQMRITEGGEVSVRHNDRGNAGNLEINAERLTLNNQGRITATTASGKGGDIVLNLQQDLFLRRGSFISTQAGGAGRGGDIIIKSPVIVGFENSDIIANAFRGSGGNISITTQGIFGLKFRPQLTPENDITASSQFGLSGTVQINNFAVNPSSGLVTLPVDLTDPSNQVAKGCAANQGSSFVVTGRGGVPRSPTQSSNTDRPWTDTRDLTAVQHPSASGPTSSSPQAPLIQAIDWRRNADGKVELYTDSATPPSVLAEATCAIASP
jgi:filamentous hemagglutinin family protein